MPLWFVYGNDSNLAQKTKLFISLGVSFLSHSQLKFWTLQILICFHTIPVRWGDYYGVVNLVIKTVFVAIFYWGAKKKGASKVFTDFFKSPVWDMYEQIYYVTLNSQKVSPTYFTRTLENWQKDSLSTVSSFLPFQKTWPPKPKQQSRGSN